jgi:hypothetical protein
LDLRDPLIRYSSEETSASGWMDVDDGDQDEDDDGE